MTDDDLGSEGGYGVTRPSAEGDEDDYEAQWDDLDGKVILAQLLAEQQRTNRLLAQALQDGAGDAERDAPTYECTKCPGEVRVPAGDRERHARSEHNAPPDVVNALFTEVE